MPAVMLQREQGVRRGRRRQRYEIRASRVGIATPTASHMPASALSCQQDRNCRKEKQGLP